MSRPDRTAIGTAAGLLLLAACAVGPDYHKPDAPVPAGFREAPPEVGDWKKAEPADRAAVRGKWWMIFGDPDLDALEERVESANQTVAIADARFRAARAAVRVARADFFPNATAEASIVRGRAPATRLAPGGTTGTTDTTAGTPVTSTVYTVRGDASWEIDLWGRVRRNVESAVASVQASAADLENARLSMQAELAVDWWQLHGLDGQKELLDTNVAAYEKALELTKNRHDEGIVSGVDVAQAETLLEATRSQALDVGVGRAQFEHAIATLVGRPPADLEVPPATIAVVPPVIPVALPSDLLERRPDVAAAERRAASASALIGVAKAAYFPQVTVEGSLGWAATTLSKLFTAPAFFWSLGPSALATIFDAGKRHAVTDQRRAEYDEAVATYRQTVLTALQEVEDALAALRLLAQEEQQQAAAVRAAERALTLARNRYDGGITTYLEVVTAQAAALSAQRNAVDLKTRRLVASVNLAKAVGGSWSPPPGQ